MSEPTNQSLDKSTKRPITESIAPSPPPPLPPPPPPPQSGVAVVNASFRTLALGEVEDAAPDFKALESLIVQVGGSVGRWVAGGLCMHECVCICMCINICVCMCMCARMHVCVFIYIYVNRVVNRDLNSFYLSPPQTKNNNPQKDGRPRVPAAGAGEPAAAPGRAGRDDAVRVAFFC